MSSNCIGDVTQFMQACGHKVTEADEGLQRLYHNLIEEEYQEFLDAKGINDDVEMADACADLIWVIIGLMRAKGWDAYGIWNEVAHTNLCKIDPVTGKVLRREDGKIMKPEGWTPPNIAPFLKG